MREPRGFPVPAGYIGYLKDGSQMLFSTEEEYKEFIGGDTMERNNYGNRIPDKQYLIESHIRFEREMEELKQIYANTERAYKKYVLGTVVEED